MNPFTSREELAAFIQAQVMTSAQVVDYLGITRQTLKSLVDRAILVPIIDENKTKIFLRQDVEARKSEAPELKRKYRPYDDTGM